MKTTKQQTVLLGVTGSIAAYKACELLRLLQKEGLRVKVVMTEHACSLVGPATFKALSGESVAVSLFDDPEKPINHISLAEEADIVAIAPCTANVLNKIANGVADDLLTTTVLASTAPLVVAPAMNVAMLRDNRTQESLRALEMAGVTIVGPGEGYLACGVEDSGRMSSPEEISTAIRQIAMRSQSLAGKRVLITAGPTREYLDPVRFISSPASGKMGFALAREAKARGADVYLVSGPTEQICPSGIVYAPVTTAQQMQKIASEYFDASDIAIFAAAVADFRPAHIAENKLKKGVHLPSVITRDQPSVDSEQEFEGPTYILELTANPDILASLAKRRKVAGTAKPYIVGFAAETEDLLANAQAKLHTKGADLIIANDVSSQQIGFASNYNKLLFVSTEGVEETELLSKEQLSGIILDRIQQRL